MISVEILRDCANALPGVVESTPSGLPLFSVGGRNFLGVEKSRSTVVLAVDEFEAGALVAGHQELYEEVVRPDGTFIGVRVDLYRVPELRLRELIVAAWRNTAPADLLVSRPRPAR